MPFYYHRNIKVHYQTLITRGFECICEGSIRRAFHTKSNIELLLRLLAHKNRTEEVMIMEANLLLMRENLTLLINSS